MPTAKKDTSNEVEPVVAKDIDDEVDKDLGDIEETKKEVRAFVDEALAYFEYEFHTTWDEMSSLYRGIRKRGTHMLDWQNNMASGKAFGVVMQAHASLMAATYPNDKLWALRAVDNPEQNKEAPELWKKTMLLQSKKMHLRRNISWTVLDGLINDYGILKYGYKWTTQQKRYLDYKTGKVKVVGNKETISMPFFKSVSPFDLLVDLDAMSWDEVKKTAERVAISLAEIDADPTYNVKSEIERFRLDKVTDETPSWTIFEGWEYHTPSSVVVMLDGGYVIKRHWTLLKSNEIPYLIWSLFPEQRTPGGFGLLRATKGSLMYIDKIMNSNADTLDLAIQPPFTINSTSDVPFSKLKIGLGKVFKVDLNDKIGVMEMPGVRLDSYKEMELHNQFITDIAGNQEQYAGDTATQDKFNAMQTTAKVRETAVQAQEEFVEPLIRAWLDMDQQFMTLAELEKIHGKEKAALMKIETDDEDKNIDLEIDITGELTDIERTVKIDNFARFTQSAEAVVQIAAIAPNLAKPMLQELVEIFGYKDKFPMDDVPDGNTTPEQIKAIKNEAVQLAQAAGVTPEAFMAALEKKTGLTSQALMATIIKAGSIKNFLQTQGGTK